MVLQHIKWVFSEQFWMAENLTWKDFENRGDGVYIAQPRDLWYILPAAIALYLLRLLFEAFIAHPVGAYNNLQQKVPQASSNAFLEAEYKKKHYLSETSVVVLAKKSELTERQIQRWFRRRRNQDRPTTMVKFTETAWRFTFYLGIFIYGLVVLMDKSWFYDVKDCWRGHPRQHVPPEIFWYYIIEMGFYFSLLFSQFMDVQRKDFWEHFIHHIATLLLMTLSWCTNFVRVGSIILCLHDGADYFLEGAKLARYCNKRTLCDVLFGTFSLVWLCTRLSLYPYLILWTVGVDAAAIAGFSHGLFVFNFLLWVLQVLHIFWFIMIMRVVITALTLGKVDKDVRSASEESEDDNNGDTKTNQKEL